MKPFWQASKLIIMPTGQDFKTQTNLPNPVLRNIPRKLLTYK